MKNFKKFLSIAMVLVMVFAMTATAFADTTGTCSVKFYVPAKYADLTETYHNLQHSGYSVYGQKEDVMTGEEVDVYEYSGTVNLATMSHPAVSLPDGFSGLYNTSGNVFDAIYNLAVTQKQEAAAVYGSTAASSALFVYGFDTPAYTESSARADGIFINKLSGDSTVTLDYSYGDVGESYWLGYSWSFYVVPATVTDFDPLNPDETYKSDLYTNNVNATDGYTYYMIYEYNEQTW